MEEKLSRYIIDRKADIKLLEIKERLLSLKPSKDFILSIVGPRRAGKTYFLYYFIMSRNLKEEDYLFVNFEEIDIDLEILVTKHQEIYGKYPEFLFLDEIQNLKNWERQVYRFFERKRFYIFLTGSSSKFLSKEIATQLRGRSLTLKIYPFSFREILKINNLERKFYSSEEVGRVKNLLRTCIKEGSFPDIVLKKMEPFKFVSEFIDLVIYRDIMERYGIKNRVGLEFFIKNAIASNSNIFSINKIYNNAKSSHIKIAKDTLYEFQRFLEDVNVISFMKKYSKSLRKRETSLPKAYIIDNGLYTFTTYRYDIGQLLESFVFQELLKSGYESNKNLYYLGDAHEVDFVLLKGEDVEKLIQVTYASNKEEIKKRELSNLIKASKNLKCKDLLVITWAYEDEMKIEDKIIKFLPLWKWLISL